MTDGKNLNNPNFQNNEDFKNLRVQHGLNEDGSENSQEIKQIFSTTAVQELKDLHFIHHSKFKIFYILSVVIFCLVSFISKFNLIVMLYTLGFVAGIPLILLLAIAKIRTFQSNKSALDKIKQIQKDLKSIKSDKTDLKKKKQTEYIEWNGFLIRITSNGIFILQMDGKEIKLNSIKQLNRYIATKGKVLNAQKTGLFNDLRNAGLFGTVVKSKEEAIDIEKNGNKEDQNKEYALENIKDFKKEVEFRDIELKVVENVDLGTQENLMKALLLVEALSGSRDPNLEHCPMKQREEEKEREQEAEQKREELGIENADKRPSVGSQINQEGFEEKEYVGDDVGAMKEMRESGFGEEQGVGVEKGKEVEQERGEVARDVKVGMKNDIDEMNGDLSNDNGDMRDVDSDNVEDIDEMNGDLSIRSPNYLPTNFSSRNTRNI